jgi:pimeloyl-ACP methyl ester carboxylesterase
VLLLSGESDAFARIEILRREVGKLAHAELVTYPNAGHGLKGLHLDDALARAAQFVLALQEHKL